MFQEAFFLKKRRNVKQLSQNSGIFYYLCALVYVPTVLAVVGERVAISAFTRERSHGVTATAVSTDAKE